MVEIYQNELIRSKIYKILKERCSQENDNIGASILSLVNDIVTFACDKSKTILKYMPEYTLHDQTHLFRVLLLMERLIPPDTLDQLSIPELMMLILSAFLHDIGMAPEEEDISAWKKIWADEEPTAEEYEEHKKYDRFRSTYPHKIEEINKLVEYENYQKAALVENYIISEYIRTTHTKRARVVIANNWSKKIKYEDKNLTYELAQLCFSHGESALSLLEMETNVLCGENIYICLPFIGVVIRLADLLDFDAKRTPSVLFSHLSVRNPVSLLEWQKHRSIHSWIIKSDKIAFHAKCSHPAIEKSIHEFCDYIDKELTDCSNVLNRIEDDLRENIDFYKILLPAEVDRGKIQTEIDVNTNEPLYLYKDTHFELSKDQIIDLLMGTKLYDDTKSALREIIQNSIDACLLSAALHKKLNTLYEPEIVVKYYGEDGRDVLHDLRPF